MNRKQVLTGLAASALATTFAVAFTGGSATADPLTAKATDARADLVGNVDAGLIDAMADHFDITTAEVYDRLAVEAVAADLLETLPDALDDTYAGMWVSDDADAVMVATTSKADADAIAAEGGTPVVVANGIDELNGMIDDLDAAQGDADVYGYYIDVTSNGIVIEAADEASGLALAEKAGLDAADVTVDTTADAPETFFVRGGDAYIIDNRSRCSVGFAVTRGSTRGFVTAGHCGRAGARVTGGNASPGTFQASVFPGSDGAWVSVPSNMTLYNIVNMYSGSRYVYNSNVASIGSSVCRSGSTTGWRCGTIQAYNQTVNYSQGQVRGLTRTSACAEPGDSGGSFITGNSAQGVTSGGSGNCTWGGTTFFQPVNPMLNTWGLTLVTSTIN
jgi:streptogrisin C